MSVDHACRLIDAWRVGEKRRDARAAVLPCMLSNMMRGKDDAPCTPGHIFLSLATDEQIEEFAKESEQVDQDRIFDKFSSALRVAMPQGRTDHEGRRE